MRSERDKNHREGTNVDETGVIPCMQLGSINPGELFGEYLKFVPSEGTMEGRGGYLFPKPRDVSRSFNIHAAGENGLFQPNQPGIKCKFTFQNIPQHNLSGEEHDIQHVADFV